MTTYQGSCQCKRVRFEVDVDFATNAPTTKCNCTSCWKRRWWGLPIKPAGFRSLAGAGELETPRGFCKHCGMVPYAHVAAAEWNDGEYYGVNVAALDGLDAATIAAIPVRYLDGLHDTWAPLEEPDRRHL